MLTVNTLSYYRLLLIGYYDDHDQCDQIGGFIGLWATFQRLWQ